MSSPTNVSDTDVLLVETDGRVATLTVNRPPHNALSMAVVDALEDALPRLAEDTEVRAVVLRSAGGRSFSVGADITEFGAAVSRMTLEGMIVQRLRVIRMVEELPKPVVCAIHGACVGGGLELALGCHFRIAATGARIGLPEIELGIIPAWGGTQRLTRTVGRAHALDLMLRARKIDASEALAIGLVSEVCEPEKLDARAAELAAELAGKAPVAVAAILDAVVRGGALSLEEGLAVEFEGLERASRSADAAEGITAFFEKREPRFTGK